MEMCVVHRIVGLRGWTGCCDGGIGVGMRGGGDPWICNLVFYLEAECLSWCSKACRWGADCGEHGCNAGLKRSQKLACLPLQKGSIVLKCRVATHTHTHTPLHAETAYPCRILFHTVLPIPKNSFFVLTYLQLSRLWSNFRYLCYEEDILYL